MVWELVTIRYREKLTDNPEDYQAAAGYDVALHKSYYGLDCLHFRFYQNLHHIVLGRILRHDESGHHPPTEKKERNKMKVSWTK